MPFVVAAACIDVKDLGCLDVCPVDCIYQGRRSVYINPMECIDCGLCESVCPVAAIYADDRFTAAIDDATGGRPLAAHGPAGDHVAVGTTPNSSGPT